MSAFIVDDQVINRILSGIDYAILNNNGHFEGIPKPYGETLTSTEPDQLGVMLRALNERAVLQRYPDCTPDNMPGPVDENGKTPAYEYTWEPYPPIMQLYKDIACLVYQCTEGDVIHDPLYKQLQEYYNDLAHAIVHRLDGWNKAKWGE